MLAITALYRSDIPVMQAAVVMLAIIITLVNFAVDMAVTVLDPRLRRA